MTKVPRKRRGQQGADKASARIDLAPFCAPEAKSPLLAQPWTQAGFTYATDARVIIRVPAQPGDVPADHPFTNSIEKFLADYPAPVDARFSALPTPDGTGSTCIACRECHGSGAILNEDSKPLVCPCCKGEKQTENTTSVAVGNRLVATHYLFLLAALPGIRIAAKTGKPHEPLCFAFDGGEGLVMPVTLKS